MGGQERNLVSKGLQILTVQQLCHIKCFSLNVMQMYPCTEAHVQTQNQNTHAELHLFQNSAHKSYFWDDYHLGSADPPESCIPRKSSLNQTLNLRLGTQKRFFKL